MTRLMLPHVRDMPPFRRYSSCAIFAAFAAAIIFFEFIRLFTPLRHDIYALPLIAFFIFILLMRVCLPLLSFRLVRPQSLRSFSFFFARAI